jgi:hypothetical protein
MNAGSRSRVRTMLAALGFLLAASMAQAAPRPCEADPQPLADGGFKVAFVPDSATAWQPTGGEVRFVLKGDGIPAADMKVDVCFRWHGRHGPMPWHPAPPPRIVESKQNEVTLAVLVPQELREDWPNWFDFGNAQQVEYSGFNLVPLADMHIVSTSMSAAWTRIDVVQQVGITHRLFALIPAVGALVFAWLVFLSWGRARGIKGGPLLSVISTPGGVGSLSQFQIMLWTFLIAGGVMYVMALSGSMIDIPQAALGLLGIAGVVTLGAKFKAGSSAAPPAANPPGAVTGLAVSGVPTGSTVTLTWTPPAGADPTTAYTVQVRQQGTLPWLTAAPAVAAPPYAVTGLSPANAYEFQVFAVTAAGSGPASTPLQATTATAAAPVAGAPGPVTGLTATPGAHAESEIRLSWATPAPAPDACVVQYRPAGTWAWATASGAAASPFTVTGLAGNTDYEFQVFAVNAGLAGSPSALAIARTALRTPQWADLVVTGTGEIDVTRVQMLLFTVIAAAFVAMKLFDQNQIPDIPSGILTLMGISNGVYLAAKFVPGGK